ncbi:autotransporter outer membrane beta-barrel domain-containing protein [Bordetella sp. 02P26C-1]|uniref:autotransporter outer membrane beta-barrel domain-containing protein n=1 Tax=Bordetella sp. 02P26C-1 TaxID=2683195 RepID=UPI0013537E61|nr:autotransporter outer membrane beta-barrel domain-containing protein [Bordetella sp. 02P26C-1]MVW80744.1 autotransporter outer membrane beta-barrel domain-containing protein [Bordetella sp. 02P26C-1]
MPNPSQPRHRVVRQSLDTHHPAQRHDVLTLNYASKLLLVLSYSALPMAHAQSNLEGLSCTNSQGAEVCSNSSGQTMANPAVLIDQGNTLQVTTNSNVVYSAGDVIAGAQIISQGVDGSADQFNGGASGAVTLINNGSVDITLTGWESQMAIGLRASSRGGVGYSPEHDDDGGHGGDSGTVQLTNNASVTLGEDGGVFQYGVMGVYAQAAGGTGGTAHSHAIDHYGGNGGNAGAVTLNNHGAIGMGTSSDLLAGTSRAWAVAAESVGGRGGMYAKGQRTDGNAGTGGSASSVTLNNTANIALYWQDPDVTDDGAVGVMARSVGGDGGESQYSDDSGGNGGDAGSVAVNVGEVPGTSNPARTSIVVRAAMGTTPSSVSAGAAITAISRGGVGGTLTSHGASGGQGGNADTVSIQLNNTSVQSIGDYIAGVVGFSRGANGGSGDSTDRSTNGGNGGKAGNVSISLDAGASSPSQASSITTQGLYGYGLLAQSIGGFGGTGTSQGGTGANAGTASATTNLASIRTSGNYAAGVIVQSIGGGGGTGTDFTWGLAGSGGNGGNGGNGAAVTITSSGNISTIGQHAYGLLAQSIGGSGGTGGVGVGLIAALGGDSGAGGAGSTVQVTNAGNITTSGYASNGMVGQSIGGGGGAAGSATGLFAVGGNVAPSGTSGAGSVTMTNAGSITTAGDAAIAMLGQSIGGGGGTAASAAGLLSIGGTGGNGGQAGDVTLNANGKQQTAGEYAYGVVAQSIGGGGGNGGNAFALSTAAPAISIGGNGGIGGNAGNVNLSVNNNGTVVTSGAGATAVLAQSIGGGGGSGGSAKNATLFSDATLSIGGAGEAGASAGQVNVQASGANVRTYGASASGIVAQAIGGGGGIGGTAESAGLNVGFNLAVAVGGTAGGGGAGGKVLMTLSDTVVATSPVDPSTEVTQAQAQAVAQSDAYGVLAQSIGGGGGSGGSATGNSVALPVPISEDTVFALASSIAVGGKGGLGGDGGEVDVVLNGSSLVVTNGQGAHGVLAQSIGGGGGNGGDSNAMSRTFTTPEVSIAVNVDASVGGSGNASGHAGAIDLQLNDRSQIVTYGDYSNALMAQGIGGGGGNAGVGSSGTGGIAQGKSYTVNVGVGGKGTSGGAGSNLTATTGSGTAIGTAGSGSRGILMQSIGGGGGASQGTTVSLGLPLEDSGGGGGEATTSFTAAVSISVGATGGQGGSGGSIVLTDASSITTRGNDADGVLLQSIGGGGGLGGSAGSDASAGPSSYPGFNPSDDPPSDDNDLGTYGLSVTVGGQGGAGGNGSAITVNYSGITQTQGDLADAMIVQSIGGGGGVGGTATAKGARGTANLTIAVGGSGGDGGNGGDIDLNFAGKASGSSGNASAGQLITRGNAAYGLLVQSIGGGGGQAADGSADVTYKTGATPSLLIGVGGRGGAGGTGGAINMNAANSLIGASTYGAGSHAIVLQSIGGGGGAASAGASTDGSIVGEDFVLSLGGGGQGTASGAGAITVDSIILSHTQGPAAYGLVAQSIGGGGGIAYVGPTSPISSANIDTSEQANSFDASGGNVHVSLSSVNHLDPNGRDPYNDISTAGFAAHGIVLQSIGGGGGIAGSPDSQLQMGWQGAGQQNVSPSGADAGDVRLDMGDMTISVTGDNSVGVLLQSIADGGGVGTTSQGSFAGSVYDHTQGGGSKAGAITFTQTSEGTLSVTGANPVAIFAQSDGNIAQASPISITIGGMVQTAPVPTLPNAYGVWLDGGSDSNVVTVAETAYLISTIAVQQTRFGTITVNNAGTIAGSQFLSADSSATVGVVNNTGTLINAATIKGTVVNAGNVIVGSPYEIDQMRVTNDFVQREKGTLHIGADFNNRRIDQLVVGRDAHLNGQLSIAASTLMPNRELTFVQAGSVNAAALKVHGASSLFDFNTHATAGAAAVSVGRANFDKMSQAYGLGENLREVGDHLQNIWERGSTEALGSIYARLDRLANNAQAYSSAMSDLSPGLSAAPAALATRSMKTFADSLFSCPQHAANTLQQPEGDCVWGRVSEKTSHLDPNRGTAATRARSTSYQLGAQRRIAPQWVLGVAGAYENNNIRSDDSRIHTKGDAGYVGLVLKYETGPWTFSGATYGSYASYDTERRINLTGETAKSDPKVWSIGQQLRAAYTVSIEKAYIKPYANVDLIYTHMPSYTERDAGPLNLDVANADQLNAMLTPGVEVGGLFQLRDSYTLRPFVNAGVSVSTSDKWETRARLTSAPADSHAFKTTLETGRVFGHVSVGMQLAGRGGFDLRAQYDGLISSQTRSSGGTIKAIWRF